MAEFTNTPSQVARRNSDVLTAQGMNAFGKPVPESRKHAAMQHCRAMGMTDTNKITSVIDAMSESIRRDEPYRAMEAAGTYLDITGCYRLLAALCVDEPEPPPPVERTMADLYTEQAS